MASANDRPRAQLYVFDGSVWASVPRIGLVEKGYSPSDLDIKQVNLLKGENFAPSYLRLNPNGTVPTLVVPTSDTTSEEVATKFRAITDSKQILAFLDESRSQHILEAKGQGKDAAAPVLSPATIEGKALSDSLIALVHGSDLDPNFLLLSARTLEEVKPLKEGIAGVFVNGQVAALKRYQAQVQADSNQTSNPDANPRSAAHNEQLLKWYTDKLHALSPAYHVYGPESTQQATQLFIQLSRSRWQKLGAALAQLERQIRGPYALGDQVSLADAHLMAWFARVIAVCESKESAKDLDALEKALQHEAVAGEGRSMLGPKVRAYWQALKSRPSFQAVYKDGLH
ncbi:hypothetical protein K437DRAFT_239804 [Tilletiaria anomala UBC 951]|uniref:GST N-terminal domain-containing protein n=1 Tax=Tilletiaria anomala (strain ATCC 24038 / CBS 436.72 / UBC 951) TaxID=1037660 RepID=A0A066VK47_TILAU|nr:uncharacterized protein K437DRAFT_239804 [Tilletiaria anomala UBC 951]KDN38940.1 hypothetical protein K437DRAFT_239804 [Tilletiaria anomala UBC 951]